MRTMRLVTTCLVILMLLISPSHAEKVNEQLLIDGYLVEFRGVDYDAAADVSTWTYQITRRYGPHLQDLQLGVCGKQLPVVINTSHPVDLITWDRSPGYALAFHFPFGMDWDRGETVQFSVKGRPSVGSAPVASSLINLQSAGAIAGLGCQVAPSCGVDFYAESTHLNWAFLRPGIYASQAMTIHVSSMSDVILSFADFGHATYLADSTKPALHLAYSIGDTLFEAERTFGWRDAGNGPNTFNGTQVVITAAEMANGGKEIIIWAKAYLAAENSSSEYEASGNVFVRSACP